jgi:hypothetical protein
MSNENMQNPAEQETIEQRKIIIVGKLGDLNLGNPNGIPSEYAHETNESLEKIAQLLQEKLVNPTDSSATSCIDGRKVLHEADGSEAEVRLRRVGGSASNFGVALNAESSVANILQPDSSLGKQIETIDIHIANTTGFERSAHQGGCGGANGEIEDNKAINNDPSILAATKAFMEIPEVKKYFEVGYDDELGERVRVAAGKTAQLEEESDWKGQTYVEGVTEKNPRGVEVLEVDHNDASFHGHKERALVVILGEKTLPEDDYFVWNLKASKKVAEALSGERGIEGYRQALIAEVAKHMAVAKRLPSTKTPVMILNAA